MSKALRLAALGLVIVSTAVTVVINNSAEAHGRVTSMSNQLQILDTSAHTAKWSNGIKGPHITGIVPGKGVDIKLYLRNSSKERTQVSLSVPEKPRSRTGLRNWRGFTITIVGDACGASTKLTMADLISRNSRRTALPCGPLKAGEAGNPSSSGHVGNYTLHFDFDPDAVYGESASVGRFDMILAAM